MKCQTCKITMIKSTAFKQQYKAGAPDFPDSKPDDPGQTMVPSGEPKRVHVLKCPQCGYSTSL